MHSRLASSRASDVAEVAGVSFGSLGSQSSCIQYVEWWGFAMTKCNHCTKTMKRQQRSQSHKSLDCTSRQWWDQDTFLKTKTKTKTPSLKTKTKTEAPTRKTEALSARPRPRPRQLFKIFALSLSRHVQFIYVTNPRNLKLQYNLGYNIVICFNYFSARIYIEDRLTSAGCIVLFGSCSFAAISDKLLRSATENFSNWRQMVEIKWARFECSRLKLGLFYCSIC
jgi:hypothetical protein